MFCDQLKSKFPEINTPSKFLSYARFCNKHQVDNTMNDYLKKYDPTCLTVDLFSKPFYQCATNDDNDAKWNDETFLGASMAGPDSGGTGHAIFEMTPSGLNYINVLFVAMSGNYELLCDMKVMANKYVKSRNWSNVAMFFQCFPYDCTNKMRLHVVNLDTVGIHFHLNKYKNLSINAAIRVANEMTRTYIKLERNPGMFGNNITREDIKPNYEEFGIDFEIELMKKEMAFPC